MSNNHKRLLIADNQFLITESLKMILVSEFAFEWVGTATTSVELNSLLVKNTVDLLIADPDIFMEDNFATLRTVRMNHPDLPILILTNKTTKADVNELLNIKIKNVQYKSTEKEEFLASIEATLKGKKYYSEEVLDLLMEPTANKPAEEPGTLTPSEIEIVRQIANGLTTKEIASQKSISFHTVITHRKNIFRKLDINNSSELLMYAMRKGLIDTLDYQI